VPHHLSPILQSIEQSPPKCGESKLITIDGPAGSGKTTLASQIAQAIGGEITVIHMDDLYNGWERALTGELTSLLKNQLLPGVASGRNFHLPKFDWLIHKYDEPQLYHSSSITIVEGVGSGQRIMRSSTSVAIWIEVSMELGLERVLERDGFEIEAQIKGFKRAELKHFADEQTKAAADHQLYGAP